MKKINYNNIRYGEMLKEWLNYKEQSIKEQSRIKYENTMYSYIFPILGNIKYKKINAVCIQSFFKNDRIANLSPSTQKTLLYIIKNSIQYGVENKYRKPLGTLEIKIKKPKSKVIYLTKCEQEILEKYLRNKDDIRALGILVCLYTGIRLGEICGLKWEDVDFINKSISIRRTVQRIKNTNKEQGSKTKKIISSPKSNSSNRIIPLPDFLIDILAKHKSLESNYVLSDSLSFKDTRVFEKYLENTLKKCNIRNLNFHTLRHTFATRSIESGMDIKTLSEILGHSSYHITLDIYVHSTIDQKRECINNLVSYINNS